MPKRNRTLANSKKNGTSSLPLKVEPKISAFPPTATILIDPDVLFRDGLARILADTRFPVSLSAPSSEGIELNELNKDQPALFLISHRDDPHRTIKELEQCKLLCPTARTVVLSDRCDCAALTAALKAGANAYIIRSMTTTEILIKSLELVLLGEMVFSSSILDLMRGLIDSNHSSAPSIKKNENDGQNLGTHRLSAREIETLSCLVQGYSNKLIARRFDIAEATVKVHIKAILRKIRVGNRTQAAIWAMSHLETHTPQSNGNGSYYSAVVAAAA